MRWNLFNKQRQWQCGRAAEGKPCLHGADAHGHCRDLENPCLPTLTSRGKIARVNLWLFLFCLGGLLLMLATTAYSPGKLSISHRFLEQDCQSCHSTGEYNALKAVSQAFSPFPHDKENALCVDCHQFGDNASLAHNQPEKTLKQLRKTSEVSRTSEVLMAALAKTTLDVDKDLSCISCHREHQGLKHDLTAISDKSCQSCHKQTFLHFENHPEFTDYPYAEQTNINFDHQAHIGKNFDEEEDLKRFKPESCNDCHEPDDRGELMLLKGFSKTCGNCHLREIQGDSQAGAKGIAVFNIPGMDVETLREKGFVIGDWPEDADSELSVFMRLLLSGDEKAAAAMKTLDKLDLLDLRKADKKQLQAATDLIWTIKTLFLELQQQGQTGLKNRLEKIAQTELHPKQFAGLSSLLPPALFNAALSEWLPLLTEEITLYRQHDYAAIKKLKKPVESIPQPKVEAAKPKPEPESDDLLTGDDDLLADDDELLTGDENLDEDEAADSDNSSQSVSEEEWVSSGGWYRAYDSLYYRPSAHADKFLRNWLNLGVASKQAGFQTVFKNLSKPKAQGMCVKCHSIDTENKKMNWRAKRSEKNSQPFTRYAHDRHLAMKEIENCETCHKFQPYPETESENDAPPKPSFKPMEKAQCAECHNDDGIASESCLNCHNYHIGEIKLRIRQTELSVFERE